MLGAVCKRTVPRSAAGPGPLTAPLALHNTNFYYGVHKSIARFLIRARSTQSTKHKPEPDYTLHRSIHFNIIVPLTPGFSRVVHFLHAPQPRFCTHCLSHHACNISCPVLSRRLDHNNIAAVQNYGTVRHAVLSLHPPSVQIFFSTVFSNSLSPSALGKRSNSSLVKTTDV